MAPFFWLVTSHWTRNQSDRGLRVRSKIAPAVTEVWRRHRPQNQVSRHVRQARSELQGDGRTPPVSASSRHTPRRSGSVATRRPNSLRVRGWSSAGGGGALST